MVVSGNKNNNDDMEDMNDCRNTPNSTKNIADIQLGDKVLSLDGAGNKRIGTVIEVEPVSDEALSKSPSRTARLGTLRQRNGFTAAIDGDTA